MRTNRGHASSTGRWLPHALISFVAVLGVLAMHGLTMNHDAAMAGMSTGLSVAAVGPEPVEPVTGAATAGTADITHATAMSSSVRALGVATVSRVGTQHQVDAMTAACLAFLAGLVLLVAANRLLSRVRRDPGPSRNKRHVAWFATAVERLRPDLAELSVLRT